MTRFATNTKNAIPINDSVLSSNRIKKFVDNFNNPASTKGSSYADVLKRPTCLTSAPDQQQHNTKSRPITVSETRDTNYCLQEANHVLPKAKSFGVIRVRSESANNNRLLQKYKEKSPSYAVFYLLIIISGVALGLI